VAWGAAFERRHALSGRETARVRRVLGAVALTTLLIVVSGGLVVAGNPITRVRHSWESFEGGYSSTSHSGSRLVSGLGSNRYDFYRVALDEFTAHPIVGIGADNFLQQYLRHGHSDETPRYPHSVELGTLAQTGLLGALFAFVGLGAALAAGWRAMRRADDALGATVAAAALVGFGYWAVHGSFDWFWEFAGLGAPAFALLGVACGLAPAPSGAAPSSALRARGGRSSARVCALALGVPLALAAALSLGAPWLSERQVQSAARIWPKAPLAAYARLQNAAELNPLSDRALLVEGSIALRFGDMARAEDAFSKALGRVPDDAYATLELGAIASGAGARDRALVLLERAVRLNPRDPLTRRALRTVQAGRRVDVRVINREILLKAEDLA
jgi:tetratricopeptide (TPR) repeat protein